MRLVFERWTGQVQLIERLFMSPHRVAEGEGCEGAHAPCFFIVLNRPTARPHGEIRRKEEAGRGLKRPKVCWH